MPSAEAILGLAATGTSDVTNLIPRDVYSSQVLEALYAERKLAGIIAAVNEDLVAEAGSSVKVPFIGARSIGAAVSEAAALTTTATSTGVYTITLSKYGDYDLVNAEVWEDQTVFDREAFIRNMARAFAQKVDQLVYDELKTATPSQSTTLTAVSSTSMSDLYDKVVDLKAKMEGTDKASPSHLVIHPLVAAQFLKDTSEGVKFMQISVRDGMVLSVAGLQVIVTPLANAPSATAGAVVAVVIDRSRALGEAWGRRPTFEVDRVPESDQWKLVGWIRYGTSELDTKGVGHVKNP